TTEKIGGGQGSCKRRGTAGGSCSRAKSSLFSRKNFLFAKPTPLLSEPEPLFEAAFAPRPRLARAAPAACQLPSDAASVTPKTGVKILVEGRFLCYICSPSERCLITRSYSPQPR